jgi:hypothetical protein
MKFPALEEAAGACREFVLFPFRHKEESMGKAQDTKKDTKKKATKTLKEKRAEKKLKKKSKG